MTPPTPSSPPPAPPPPLPAAQRYVPNMYSTVCRLCMQHDGYMHGIFNNIQGVERSISKLIVDCTALQVARGDGLPNSICHRCLYKIELCLEFRQQCTVSDATLRNHQHQYDHNSPLQENANDNNGLLVMVVNPNQADYESDTAPGAAVPPVVEEPVEEEAGSDADGFYDEYADGDGDGDGDADGDLPLMFKNVHMCTYCDKAFRARSDCVRHEATAHSTDVPYTCVLCAVGFAERVSYSSHIKTYHVHDKPYGCVDCERLFARRSDLRKHAIVHTGVKPFTCPVCGKSFSRNTNLSKHTRIHKGHKPFACRMCARAFASKLELTRHAALQHVGGGNGGGSGGGGGAAVKRFKCEFCPMSFARRDKLANHMKRHMPELRLQAEERASELRVMRDSLMHEYGVELYNGDATPAEDMVINIDPFPREESEANEPPPLPLAEEGGTGYEDTTVVKEEDESDAYASNEVDSPSSASDDVEEEEEEEEGKGETTEYFPRVPAHISGEYFGDDDDDEEPPLPFPCPMCAMRFRTTDGVNQHMGLHNGERPFGCNVCGRAFVRKRELERHSTTHTGVKEFECDRCEKRFARKDKLLRHTRTHDAYK